MAKTKDKTVALDRRSDDRRAEETDRRQTDSVVADERRQGDRRKVQRRRQIDPTTCERDYSVDEIEFMQAMDAYKRANGRMFPTCSEILEVIRDLGYRKVTDAEELSAEQEDQHVDEGVDEQEEFIEETDFAG